MAAGDDNRPDDPTLEWTKATGSQGDVWVDRNEDGSWNIWSQDGGFSTVDNDEFEEGYELDIGSSTLDQHDE